jgi:CRISPR-associated endonuclease Cas3-HD
MPVQLYSAPEEYYLDHIVRCKGKFELLFSIFYSTMVRTFDTSVDREILKDSFLKMILFHDLGKLTRRWQERVGTNKSLPSHSTIGACYLWKVLPQGLREPISFAVAIHHADKGLLGDNIERPDVQAVLDGIVDNNGSIKWHERTSELNIDLFPETAKDITIIDLKEMTRGLRVWAKGCGLLEQHQRRMQASLAHHILKLCDISAATERKEYQKKDEKDYYGGWLMVENIKNYVDSIGERAKQ